MYSEDDPFDSSFNASLCSSGSETDCSMEEEQEAQIIKMVDSDAASSSRTPVCLNLIQQGPERWQRIGRSVCMRRLYLTLFLSSSTPAPIYVIYDRSPNGTLPTSATILAGYDQSGASSAGVLAQYVNPDYLDRFKILWSSTRPRTSIEAMMLSSSLSLNVMTIAIDLDGLVAHYMADSSPAVIGDVATGALYVIAANGFGNFSTFTSRLVYTD